MLVHVVAYSDSSRLHALQFGCFWDSAQERQASAALGVWESLSLQSNVSVMLLCQTEAVAVLVSLALQVETSRKKPAIVALPITLISSVLG